MADASAEPPPSAEAPPLGDRRPPGRIGRHLSISVAVLVVIVGLGVIADRSHAEVDLTAGHSLTLSSATRSVLAHVHEEVHVEAFLLRGDPDRVHAASLLTRYRRQNHRVSFKVLDPNEAPGEAARLDIDPAEGGVALTMGKRLERAPTVTEQDLTAGIARLVRGRSPVACFTQGHGEPSPDDATGQGVGTLAALLSANGYRIEKPDLLLAPSVPPTCETLVVVNPTAPLGPAESALSQWLAGGGRAVVLNDPASTVDLSPVVHALGVTVVHGLVLEADDGAHVSNDPLSPIVSSYPSSSPVVRKLPPTVFPTAEAVVGASDVDRGLTVSVLAQTTGLSFLSRRPLDTRTHFDPAVDWVSLDEDLVGVSANIAPYRPLALTAARLRYLRFLTAGVVPAFFLLGGGLVWAWRRRR